MQNQHPCEINEGTNRLRQGPCLRASTQWRHTQLVSSRLAITIAFAALDRMRSYCPNRRRPEIVDSLLVECASHNVVQLGLRPLGRDFSVSQGLRATP